MTEARKQIEKTAKQNWDTIAKPIDSLGLLEDYVVKLCGIYESVKPPVIDQRAVLTFCADHGVVQAGVTQTGQEVTKIVAENFAKNSSTVNIMAKSANVDVYVIDVGMNTQAYPTTEVVMGQVIDRKISRGTKNLYIEPAMARKQCEAAIDVGRELVRSLKESGYKILATGEMGIGNTTPTSTLACLLLDLPAEVVTGKGAGLSDEGVAKKCQVVQVAAARVKEQGLTDYIDILANVGGYEIAAMVGVYLEAAKSKVAVVLDGVISTVAGLVAYRIDENVKDYLIASHVSKEPAAILALEEMGLEAIVHGRMCLGEGTGAMTVFPILDMAIAVYEQMGSFTDYAIDPYTRFV